MYGQRIFVIDIQQKFTSNKKIITMYKLLKTLILSVLVFANQTTKAQFCFNISPTNPTTSISTSSFGTNDFNNDGKPDFYVAYGSKLSVILQLPNLNLDTIIPVDTTTFSNTSCSADFNNDGNADIITYDYGPGQFSIYFGNGNGTFLPPNTQTAIGMFNATNRICTADFNNDGKADLAISTSFYLVKILLGNGNGTFGSAITSNTITNVRGQLIPADLNADGKMDLATPSIVLLGDGTGNFSSGTILSGTFYPQSVTSADFNNDGKLDVATLNWGTSTLTAGYIGNTAVFLGDGTGNFATPIFSGIGDSTIPNNTKTTQFINSDFDNDGKIDLAMANIISSNGNGNYSSYVSVLKGDGLGAFPTITDFPSVTYPQALLTVDINQDGNKDIAAIANYENVTVSNSKLIPMYNCSPTGIHEWNENDDISIFPNPNSGTFTISSLKDIEEISIYDVLGQVVFHTKEKTQHNFIHLKNNGIYFINIKMNHHTISQKIIINN